MLPEKRTDPDAVPLAPVQLTLPVPSSQNRASSACAFHSATAPRSTLRRLPKFDNARLLHDFRWLGCQSQIWKTYVRTISAANKDKRKHIRHSNAQDLLEIIFHLGCRAHVFGPMVVVGQLDIATARDQLLPSAHYAALLHGGFNATWASELVRLTMQTTLKIEMPRIATSQEFVRGIGLAQGDPEAAATHSDCLDMIKASLLNKWCGLEFGCSIPDPAERICLEWHADNIFLFANST